MGRVRVRAALARVGVLAGGLTSATGVGLGIDLAAGLMAGGAVVAAWCLFLADVDPAEGGGRRERP
ncbi:hypothetical protein ABZ508_02615 [Streptomyces lavendulocolor]|uniref:Uncharacterized protein n=1 Tax=Streptomyces lavendulocolor TaxID=67316 RepID=A0ABV2VY90_9ACTN